MGGKEGGWRGTGGARRCRRPPANAGRPSFQHLNRPADSMERDQLEECQSHYAKPFISSPRRPSSARPSVRPLPRLRFRSPGERRRRLRRLVGQSSLPAMPVRCLSSNRPPARRGPLNEQSAPSSRVKRMRRTVNGECTRKRPLSFLGAPMGRSSV